MSSFTKTLGLDLGKGAEAKNVNFVKNLDNKAKKAADFAKTLKPSDEELKKRRPEQDRLNKQKEEAKNEVDLANKTIKEGRDRIEKLRENVNKVNGDERERIRDEIILKENQVRDAQLSLQDLQKTAKEEADAAEAYKKGTESFMGERINRYAETYSKENAMWTWSKNVAKGGTLGAGVGVAAELGAASVVGAGAGGVALVGFNTTGDNRAIAKRILKDTKTESDEDKLKALTIKLGKQQVEKEAAASGGGDATPKA